ncbi:hypothetical protein P4B35_03755 [Pontiellaceae bacterium B12227]|nr:hypothetical protein [Pontiellaceae bacterium B12227]
MRSIILSLFVAMLISGCSKESKINGEYTFDTQFMAEASLKVVESMSLPDFDIQENKELMEQNFIESLDKQEHLIVIEYPKFEFSFIDNKSHSRTSTVCRINHIKDGEYLLIEGGADKSDLTLKYNKADGSLTGDAIRFIKR